MVRESERCEEDRRSVTRGIEPGASTQQSELTDAGRICGANRRATGVTLTGTGVALTCQNHATLTAGGPGFWMVNLSGATESIENCGFSPGGHSGAHAILIEGATNPNIEGNTISGFKSGNGSIYLVGTSNAIVRNNRITAGTGGPDGIFGERNTIDTTVDGNYVDESLCVPAPPYNPLPVSFRIPSP